MPPLVLPSVPHEVPSDGMHVHATHSAWCRTRFDQHGTKQWRKVSAGLPPIAPAAVQGTCHIPRISSISIICNIICIIIYIIRILQLCASSTSTPAHLAPASPPQPRHPMHPNTPKYIRIDPKAPPLRLPAAPSHHTHLHSHPIILASTFIPSHTPALSLHHAPITAPLPPS